MRHDPGVGRRSLSVVVPTYRRRADLVVETVAAIAAQGPDEIVVVLDGPDPAVADALAATVSHPRPTVVELQRNEGAAMARRAGVRAATGEVVLLMDDDIRPAADLLARHRAFHDATRGAVLVGALETPTPPPGVTGAVATRLFVAEHERAMHAWREDPPSVLRGMYGGLLSVERATYDAAEQFLPTVRMDYYEDLDLGLRFAAVGAVGHFDPVPAGVHHHAKSNAAMLREARVRGATRAALAARWGSVPGAVHTDTTGWRRAARAAVAACCRLPLLPDAVCRALERALDAAGRYRWPRTELFVARLARTVNEEVAAARGR